MIKIALVEDHLMFRHVLKCYLNQIQDFEVVLESECGRDFEEKYRPELVDIILLDLRLKGQNGTQTCINLKRKYPDIRIIIMSMYDDPEIKVKMIENGACAYVVKDKSADYLEHVIRNVMNYGFYFDLDLGAMLLQDLERARRQKLVDGMYRVEFSETEMQIAILGCQGLTNAEIADKLGIKVRTVENHKSELMLKTDSKSFGGVMIYMFKHYLLFPQQF